MNKKTNFETAEMHLLRKNFLRKWTAIEYKYNPPSALAEEERYAQYGIKLPFKIYYKYKMPFDMESSYDLLAWLLFNNTKNPTPVSEEQWYEQLRITPNDIGEEDKAWLDFFRSVPYEHFKTIEIWAKQISPDEMISEIKRLNPELAHIKTDKKTSNVSTPLLDFINGVAYGFAPADIQFCIETPRDEFHKIINDVRFQHLRHGHFPAPSRLDTLLAAEEQIKNIELQRNSGRE